MNVHEARGWAGAAAMLLEDVPASSLMSAMEVGLGFEALSSGWPLEQDPPIFVVFVRVCVCERVRV